MSWHSRWDGEHFVPLPRYQKELDAKYAIGELLVIAEQKSRSQASHNHYFAAVEDAWATLPDDVAKQWPSSDHLRKWCLIKSGHCDVRVVPCSTEEDAMRVEAMVHDLDDYAVVTREENVVSIFRAKSQSLRAMGKDVFQESKDDVFRVLSEILGATVGEVKRVAGTAA